MLLFIQDKKYKKIHKKPQKFKIPKIYACLFSTNTMSKLLGGNVDDSAADIGLIWWMLHLFSLPFGVVCNTMLLFTIAAIL